MDRGYVSATPSMQTYSATWNIKSSFRRLGVPHEPPGAAIIETRTARGALRFQRQLPKAQLVESDGRTVWKPLRPRNAEAGARQLLVSQTTNERIATWTSTVFVSQNLPQEFCRSVAFLPWFKPLTNLVLQSCSKLRSAVYPRANRSRPSSDKPKPIARISP